MRLRPLGKTGLVSSELGLGTWGLSGDAYGPVTAEEQDRVVERAAGMGITLFETADSYGRGAMLERLGRVLGSDQRYLVVAKIGTSLDGKPARKRFDRAFLNQALENLARRLAPRTPDVVLLHNPSAQAIAQGEAVGCMRDHLACGSMRSWGISAGSPEVALAAMAVDAPVVQIAFNVLWAEDYTAIETQVREKCPGLITRSALAHGLIAGGWSSGHQFPAGDHRSERWTFEDLRQRIRQLDGIRPFATGDASSMRSVALRWVLQHDLVSSMLLGPRNTIQLDQLVRDAGKAPPYLPEATLTKMEERLQELGARS